MIKEYIEGKPRLKYIETYDMVLGPDGFARANSFVEDKLHFNAEGNRLLAERAATSAELTASCQEADPAADSAVDIRAGKR